MRVYLDLLQYCQEEQMLKAAHNKGKGGQSGQIYRNADAETRWHVDFQLKRNMIGMETHLLYDNMF